MSRRDTPYLGGYSVPLRLLLCATLLTPVLTFEVAAEVRVCNHARNAIDVALGYDINGGNETKGWYSVKPGECSTPFPGAISARTIYYYVSGGGRDEVSLRPPMYVPGLSDAGGCTLPSAFTLSGGLNMSKEACTARGGSLNGFHALPTAGLKSVTIGWDCRPSSSRNGGDGGRSSGVFMCSAKIESQQAVANAAPPSAASPAQAREARFTPRCLCLFGSSAVAYFVDNQLAPFIPPLKGSTIRILPSVDCPNALICENGTIVTPPGSAGFRVRVDSVDRTDQLVARGRTYVIRATVLN